MSKIKYINNLKQLLLEKNVISDDINIIIEDYEELYDEAIERGLADEEIYKQLGTPVIVYNQLKNDLKYIKESNDKITALSPFMAIIVFFILGFAFGLWNYAWLAFLLVPITAVIVNVRGKNKLVALSPFVAVIIFFLLGMLYNIWHPAWLIFFLIPITGILVNAKEKEVLYGLGSIVVIIIFIILNLINLSMWKYNLLVLLLIPLFAYLFNYKKKNSFLGIFLLLASISGYLILLENNIEFKIAILVFIIPVIFGFINGDIKFIIDYDDKNNKVLVFGILMTIIIYLGISLIFGYWNITWLILLFIPMLGIYISEGFKHIVAYTPFIATMIFILLGFLFNAWQYAWLSYLIIPVVAIIEDDKDSNDNEN